MEFVNEYIGLSINASSDIDRSFCETTEDDLYINLNFGLFANDCLFDLAEENYLIGIRIAKSYMEKYDEPFEIVIEKQAICCNTQSKLLEIIRCDLQGVQRKIFVESSILFLLYQSQKNNFIFQADCNSCSILNRPIDMQKMQKARQFILDNLSNPLTIPIVAGFVGTNQCYLKKGFKEVYHQTIFEFIQENRMITARYMLQQDGPIISQIADRVGYSSLSSFSQSYKNYFGITPTDQMKQTTANDNR
ncbi:MAG: helix-turn-helix transcriptional regulator [Chitinophagales bacterium]